ncbi:MAG: CNNM domain-containing protein [Elusimicrobia bacterium]|nr:CNNM domain-containing protein [Elusimicrobiota bacterium]
MITFFALLAAAVFLIMNAFFVLAEFAIVKVRFTRLEELALKGNTSAKIAKEAVTHLDAYLSTCQLGITIASLGLGWLGEPAFAKLITPALYYFGINLSPAVHHSIAFAVAFTLITSLHVVVGELAPKNMAIRMPEKSTLMIAIPLKLFHHIMFVPMWLLNESANYLLKICGIKSSADELVHSEDELRMILGQSQEYGKISLGRLMMFEHLFDFGKTRVKEIMTPKSSIAFISMQKPWIENLKIIKERKLSRYPLTKNSIDETFGFIHFKDLALSFLDCNTSCDNPDNLLKIKREISTISQEIPAEKALREFQEKRIHIALVKNPENKISGLLTMEDIVEELTGEIRDEFDMAPPVRLSRIILKDACIFDLQETDRFKTIEIILNKVQSCLPLFDKEIALKAIIKREMNFSTALGHQTAFPHARLESLLKPIIVLAKSEKGINFPSADNKSVKLVFMILTPFNEPTTQLKILAGLSGLISNLTLRQRLFSVKDSEQFQNILIAFENKVME